MLPMTCKVVPGLCLALVLTPSAPAFAGPPGPAGQAAPAARSADSAFFIARGKNRNQVHYGVRVGEGCRPSGTQPVHAYWRMLEKGEKAVEPLLGIEGPAYGLKETQQVEATPNGWRVRVWLRAHPDRPIDISVFSEGGHCAARASMKMGDGVAQIDRIFVKDKWPAGVDFVMLSGVGTDGRSVREVIRP